MGKFDNFLFRCSSLGQIMSSKGDLTQGNKTYLKELFVEEISGIRKDIKSKYFEKGTFMEEEAINFINDHIFPEKILIKNKERKDNGWITGECDLLPEPEWVYDCKNAYDLFTFHNASLTDDYDWQGRGYMWLWDRSKFRLFYCLNNTPEHILCSEEKRLYYQNNFLTTEDQEYLDMCIDFRKKHNFDHMQPWERFKTWDIEHSEEPIEKLKTKITKCRGYLNDLWDEYIEHMNKNKRLMGIPAVLIASHDKEAGATIIE
jgi:hypothetical protein